VTLTIGVDVGGTWTEAAARDGDGELHSFQRVATAGPGPEGVVASVEEAISGFEPAEVAAVGVGLPGQVDPAKGSVRLAVNLGIGPQPFPLASRLTELIGIPVVVENDVRSAALGLHDYLLTQGEASSDLALVSVGTGISAGVVIDGHLHRGATGMAGEIGHVVVDPDGRLCRCGQRGCLETVAAGPAIARDWPAGAGEEAASALFSAAAGGDASAQSIVERITSYLVRAIHWLAAAYDVDTIFLGGGVALSDPTFLSSIRYALVETAGSSELAARTLDPSRVRLIVPGSHPGARGAALLAARQFALTPTSKSKQLQGGDR
jgi:predicted NBD/HSP70 family sugar kinase